MKFHICAYNGDRASHHNWTQGGANNESVCAAVLDSPRCNYMQLMLKMSMCTQQAFLQQYVLVVCSSKIIWQC